ncbi:hypothetical protein [Subtercola lobariae]|uniref:Uncharacterized protein n=1 Tax=Subtercola lobariae TaxID=1588641 RepID=A0A917B0F9_9MICO|nr:hypothetical protein [Subtercola lobariae]GGF14473.1 hypothetical protein GCM10011399_05390 [Subtercola lobariae]
MDDHSETQNSAESGRLDARQRRPVLLIVLGLLLLAESFVVLAVGAWQITQLLQAPPEIYSSAIALIVMVLAAGLWVLVTAIGVFRLRPWTRGSALTWQVLQIIVAICCFQGIFGSPDDGWPLLIAGLLGIALLLAPQVVAVTRREI